MGTTIFLDTYSHKVIGTAVKINSARSKCKNHEGSARSMEGAGTLDICKEFTAQGFKLVKFLHDGDGSSMKSVRKVFPDCVECRCINHWAKGVSKKVGNFI